MATELATYPDVTVVCGEVETAPDDANAVVNPTVLVEVLSDGTEAYDRGEKFEHYRQIPTLCEYLLVSHRARRLELRSRAPDGSWVERQVGRGDTVVLESIGAVVAVDEVYERSPLTRVL